MGELGIVLLVGEPGGDARCGGEVLFVRNGGWHDGLEIELRALGSEGAPLSIRGRRPAAVRLRIEQDDGRGDPCQADQTTAHAPPGAKPAQNTSDGAALPKRWRGRTRRIGR